MTGRRKKGSGHDPSLHCAQNKWKKKNIVDFRCRLESQHFLQSINHFKSLYDIYSMQDG